MTTTDSHTSATITAGLIDRKQLAAEWRCSERTVIRRERAGMPYIKLGVLRLYEPMKVRAWVLQHEHRPATPKVGRPRKRAA